MQYFIKTFENTVRKRWNDPALDEYNVSSRTYGQLAADIETIHLYLRKAGLKYGDKIAINAKSSTAWATTFMATISGGYVSVQLFNGYTPTDTMGLVNHSDSRLLFTEKAIFSNMDFEQMPELLGAIDLKSGELLASRNGFAEIYQGREAAFAEAHPNGLQPSEVSYVDRPMDEVCAIMYTSGSTGNPKGVLLTVRNFSANVELIPVVFPYKEGDNYVSVLPYAHIFGLVYDMVAPLCIGLHLVVLGLPPVPAYLRPALEQFNPRVFFAVPLILAKMIDATIGADVRSKEGAAKLADYENNADYCAELREKFVSAFGKNIEIMVTGGAALPEHLELLLAKKLQAPLVTGYGMTECAPTISLGHLGNYKLKSCGEYVKGWVDVKIASPNPGAIPGELSVKGDVVFAGYYKAPETTREVLSEDGWFRTGDMGVIDEDGTLFLVGRCKSMLLSSNGQNIFPEEIEVVLNALPYVAESVVVSRDKRLCALIVPNRDLAAADGISDEQLDQIMKENISVLNSKIPAYSAVSLYELQSAPFCKTPKGSIKRFMYN